MGSGVAEWRRSNLLRESELPQLRNSAILQPRNLATSQPRNPATPLHEY